MRKRYPVTIALLAIVVTGCGDDLPRYSRPDIRRLSDKTTVAGVNRARKEAKREAEEKKRREDKARGRADILGETGTTPRSIAGAIRRGEISGKDLPGGAPGTTVSSHEAMPDIPKRPMTRTRKEAISRCLADLSSPNGHLRFVAASNAGALRLKDAVGGLQNLVERNSVCAAPAIRSLGQIGGDEAARILSRSYGHLDSTRLDMLALRYLGRTRSRVALKLLSSVARKGDIRRRIEAVHSLGLLGFPEAAPVLRSIISQKDAAYQLRIAAACGLARLGFGDGMGELQKAVARGGPDAQRIAIEGLVALVGAKSPPSADRAAADRSKAVRSIASALGSPYPSTWRSAIVALATMRPINALPVINALGAAAGDVPARARLAAAAFGGRGAVDTARSAVVSADQNFRAAGCDVAAALGDRRLVDDVAFALADSFPSVRVAAARCLGALGGDRAIVALKKALANKDAVLRAACRDALLKIRARGGDIAAARPPARSVVAASDSGFELERVVSGADGASFCVLRLPDERVALLRQGESAADGYVVALIGLRPGGGGRVVLERNEQTVILETSPGESK